MEEKCQQIKVLIVVPIFLSQVDKTWKSSSTNDNEVKFTDTMPDAGTVRRIDAGVLNIKHLFMLPVLVLLFSAVTYLNVDVNL